MSPTCFGKVMIGGRVRSTGAPDMVPSCPAPAAVPKQRRRSTLEFHRFQRRADSQRVSPEHRRLTHALLLSLLIHALLLSLILGGQGLWRPGFGFPWQVRRIEAPDLRVVVVPPQVTAAEPAVTPVAEPSQQAWVEQPVASGPARTPPVSRAPTPRRTAAAIVPEANPRAEGNPRTDAATGAAPAQTPLRGDRPGDTAPVIAAAPSVSIPETAMPSLRDAGDAARPRIDQEAGERAVELAKLDPSKQEGQRTAEQLEAARQEAEQREAARQEAAELQEAARQVAARQDAARQEAARAENVRLEAEHQEAARQERLGRRRLGRRRRARRPHGRRQNARRRHRSRPHGSRPHRSKLRKMRPQDGKRRFGAVDADPRALSSSQE